MRWLTEASDALRMEYAGFGVDLVSGNYEFASLIIIDDEEFWCRYGGHIEANWESVGLRLYSSRDRELLAELIADERWSNEGLFALITDPTKAPMLYVHFSPSSDWSTVQCFGCHYAPESCVVVAHGRGGVVER
jgi:hypothetical protein